MSEQMEPMDPANQSLTDALNLSFRLLKGIMILVVLLFLGSGVFSIDKHEVGLVLRFGKVVGSRSNRVLQPGLHWAFPFPIDEVVRIPAEQNQTLHIRDFWYYQSETEELDVANKIRQADLPDFIDPIKRGYCLTGDTNIIHCLWEVKYLISDPYDYYVAQISPQKLLKNTMNNATIKVAASFSVQDALFEQKTKFEEMVKSTAQKELDRLQCGLTITSVTPKLIPPRKITDAFESVLQAKAEYGKKVKEATNYATQLQNKAKGEAAKLLSEARNYALQIEKEAEGDAVYFETLVPQFRKNREIFAQRHYQQVIEKVARRVKEIFVLSGPAELQELRTKINTDPKIYQYRAGEKNSGK